MSVCFLMGKSKIDQKEINDAQRQFKNKTIQALSVQLCFDFTMFQTRLFFSSDCWLTKICIICIKNSISWFLDFLSFVVLKLFLHLQSKSVKRSSQNTGEVWIYQCWLSSYSGTSTNGHLSTTVTFLQGSYKGHLCVPAVDPCILIHSYL